MVTLLGLASALVYGAADFLGGAASRRAGALSVLLMSVPTGLAILTLISLLHGGSPIGSGLAWGFAAGLIGGAGLIVFYRALAAGPMSVVAPVSALASAVLPVAVGVARGEHFVPSVLTGVVLCLLAIGLVCMEDKQPSGSATRRRTLDSGPVLAIAAGIGFGCFFVLLREAGSSSGLWPVAAARAGGLVVILASVRALRLKTGGAPLRRPAGATLLLALCAGLLDAGANILYFLASQAGLLSLAAVLASLYPAITVLLARIVYAERLRTIQRLGLSLAAIGVTLVTVT